MTDVEILKQIYSLYWRDAFDEGDQPVHAQPRGRDAKRDPRSAEGRVHGGDEMLKTEREKKICEKYSSPDENDYVRCIECPLVVVSEYSDCACKANHTYNPDTEEWEPDY